MTRLPSALLDVGSAVQWLRLYEDVIDDPKVQRLPATLFRHWVNLLCLANQGKPRGRIPHRPDDIAFRLRISTEDAADVVSALVAAELIEIEDGHLVPHNWDKRQFKSDDVNARVQAHRARNVTGNVSPPTPPQHHETLHATAPDTEQRQRQKQTPPPTPPNGHQRCAFADAVGPKKWGLYVENFEGLNPLLDGAWLRATLAEVETQGYGLPPPQMHAPLEKVYGQLAETFRRDSSGINNPRAYARRLAVDVFRDWSSAGAKAGSG